MSLPYEMVNAQKTVWQYFVDRKIPTKLWPRHFMAPSQLEMVFDELDSIKTELLQTLEERQKLVLENEKLKKRLTRKKKVD